VPAPAPPAHPPPPRVRARAAIATLVSRAVWLYDADVAGPDAFPIGSTPLIVPISELRLDAAGVLRQASGSSRPVYVTQRGRLTAVLLARPMYERLIREHTILCRIVRGDLDVVPEPGAALEEVLRRGESALAEERLATARELAAEARRLEDREREHPERQTACTLEAFFEEFGIEPTWPGGTASGT
jgi:prevent-host-death family protein